MIIFVLLFLRVWVFGVGFLWFFSVKNAIVYHESLRTLLTSLLLAIIWPFILLSTSGRRWIFSTININ